MCCMTIDTFFWNQYRHLQFGIKFCADKNKWCWYIIFKQNFSWFLYKLTLTGTTLTKPSLHLHMMIASSTSGTRRLIHLHRNLLNPTFAKLTICCTHQNKRQSRISRNIQYSAVGLSQKKRWICLLLLVSLNGCCSVYIAGSVIVTGDSVCFCFMLAVCGWILPVLYP